MLKDGILDLQGFYSLALDVPDLESVRNRVTAPLELLHKRFDKMLRGGEYLQPEPYMDLALGMRECALTLQRAEIEDAPEDRLDLLRRWLPDCKALIDRIAAANSNAQPDPMGALPPMPPGTQGPPPGALEPPEMLPGMPDMMMPPVAA